MESSHEVPCARLLFPKQGIPLLLCVVRGSARLADQIDMRGRLEVIAIIGPVFVPHPFGLIFPALVVRRGIKKPAVPAAMQIRLALRARVALEDRLRRDQLHGMSALETGKGDRGHG